MAASGRGIRPASAPGARGRATTLVKVRAAPRARVPLAPTVLSPTVLSRTALPGPLLIHLGDGAEPRPVGLPCVPVGPGAERTAVADAIFGQLVAARSSTGPRGHGSGRVRRRPRWLPVAMVAAALAGAGLLAVHGTDSDTAQAPPSAGSADRAAPPGGAQAGPAAQGEPGFDLPAPAGTRARTEPLATWWVFDAAPGSITSRPGVRAELPAVVRYQSRYAIGGDQLAIAGGPLAPTTGSVDRLAAQAAAVRPRRVDRSATMGRIAAARSAVGNNRSVVVVTDRPEAWANVPAHVAGRTAVRWYVVDVTARGALAPAVGPGPALLPGAGTEPGPLATAMAFAFVDATGAAWRP